MPAKKQSIASLNRTLDKLRKTLNKQTARTHYYQEQLAKVKADNVLLLTRVSMLQADIKALKHK